MTPPSVGVAGKDKAGRVIGMARGFPPSLGDSVFALFGCGRIFERSENTAC